MMMNVNDDFVLVVRLHRSYNTTLEIRYVSRILKWIASPMVSCGIIRYGL